MHIVLSGYFGFHNTGDEAILLSLITSLKKAKTNIRITVLSNDPVHTSSTYGVEATDRWNLKQVIRVISKSDGLISGGGSLLQDATSMNSILYYPGIIQIAKWLKKPVFIYAQGVGPLNRRCSRWAVKHTLNKNTAITVRDKDSKELLRHSGVRAPIEVVPDPVFGIAIGDTDSQWLSNKSISSPFITVSVREWPSSFDYKKDIARSLDTLTQKGYAIVFVPMHGKVDADTSHEVANVMDRESFVCPHELDIREKLRIIQASELMVGMRLHALIFAADSFVPFVALSYDPKIDSFTKQCKQTLAGHVQSQNWDDHTLSAAIEDTLRRKDRREYIGKVAEMKHQAQQTTVMALDYFSKSERISPITMNND